METRQKNILIAGLLAIVLVMAVGYAAFATQLQITGSAQITSNWDVHFDKAAQVNADIAPSTPAVGIAPSGTLTYGNGDKPLTAQLHADLNQPGDYIIFTLRIINGGTLSAVAAAPTLSGNDFTINGLTATQGHVKFTVTAPSTSTLAPGGTTTMTVRADFVDTVAASCSDGISTTQEACTNNNGTWTPASTGNMEMEETGTLNITINYSQV